MAKERLIELFGGISEWNVSHSYVKYLLGQLGDGPVTVRVSSLGGDVNQGILIKKLFQDHGDITVEYVGFNASASTLLGQGAKKVLIHSDSFYLIHKPSNWVDAWGQLNEDQIQTEIERLQSIKNDLEKITMVMANEYVKDTGIELQKILQMMKESAWLTADEVLELGFVDEIISSSKKPAITNNIAAMISASGLPLPGNIEHQIQENETTSMSGILNTILDILKPKKQLQMNKDFAFLNVALGVEGIEVKENKVELTLEQITAINAMFSKKDQDITIITAERDQAVTERDAQVTAMTEITSELDEIDPVVKAASTAKEKISAVKVKMNASPAVPPLNPQGDNNGGSSIEADFSVIDSLPHNQAADKEIY